MKNSRPATPTSLFLIAVRGTLMGGADVVPGVSGGTVALVLGIYERLVTAISSFDSNLLGHLRRGEIRKAIEHVDGFFLFALASGIGAGVIGFGMFMNDLLADPTTRAATLSAFFGMIVASSLLVARLVNYKHNSEAVLYIACGLGGVAAAYLLTSSTPNQVENPSVFYLFGCGMIAICAMILPGISGAYVLVILGVYAYMTDILKGLRHQEFGAEQFWALVAMLSGCAVGLLCFSRLLRWLLLYYRDLTLASLCGLMIGALPKIWPFQIDLTPQISELKHKQFQNTIPEAIDTSTLAIVGIGFLAFACVLLIDFVASRQLAGETAESAGADNVNEIIKIKQESDT